MIPELTLDIESIEKNWTEKEDQNRVKERGITHTVEDGEVSFPVYICDDFWVKLGIFKEFKNIKESLVEYGYFDTESALAKYLKQFQKSDKNYFVHIRLMSMDYEKYYKNGSYINKDGIDTGCDYWEWIEEHPNDVVEQQFKNMWIVFDISELE